MLLRLFLRGLLIVSLTSANVATIARGHYVMSFIIGGAISAIWWTNAQSAAHVSDKRARWVYALGAACGTVTGMWLASHW